MIIGIVIFLLFFNLTLFILFLKFSKSLEVQKKLVSDMFNSIVRTLEAHNNSISSHTDALNQIYGNFQSRATETKKRIPKA